MEHVSNKDARWQVEHLVTFKGSNTFGQTEHNGVYKVYSYGLHFPMYAYKEGRWYFNKERYSMSTSRHQSQLKPYCSDFIGLKTEQMKDL